MASSQVAAPGSRTTTEAVVAGDAEATAGPTSRATEAARGTARARRTSGSFRSGGGGGSGRDGDAAVAKHGEPWIGVGLAEQVALGVVAAELAQTGEDRRRLDAFR